MIGLLFENSFGIALATAAGATLLGFVSALWLLRLQERSVAPALGIFGAVLALPPFLTANAWLDLFGDAGPLHSWFPGRLYSRAAAAAILALWSWPISAFFIRGAWRKLSAAQIEFDPLLRGLALVRFLLWPAARRAMGLSFAIVFVLAFSNLSVPALLQVKVLPVAIWFEFNTSFDYGAALSLSWPLVIAPILMLLSLRHWAESPWPRRQTPLPSERVRRRLGPLSGVLLGTGVLLLLLVCLVLPLAQLAAAPSTWQRLPTALKSSGPALAHSGFYAITAACVATGLSFLMWRCRWCIAAWVPFALPGVLSGIVLIACFNRPIWSAFYDSSGIILLAFVLRYFVVNWLTARAAMANADPNLRDWAVIEGASSTQLWTRVYWPQVAAAATLSAYAVYLLVLWDVETLLLIQPPGTETAAVRVFNLLHYGHTADVNALCLALVALGAAPVLLGLLVRSGRRAFSRAALGLCLVAAGCRLQSEPSSFQELDNPLFSRVLIIGSRGAGPGQFNKPRSVAVDRTDNLYVVDMTGRVQKFDPNGGFLLSWQMPETDLGRPKGMCLDAAGNVLVLEPHYARVNHFSPDGQLARQWGEPGVAPGQLRFPRAAAVDSKGDILVSEYGANERIQKFSGNDGTFQFGWGSGGTEPGAFNRAEGLTVDTQDRIYVADSCNHRIQVFTGEGKLIRTYGRTGPGPGELSYPYDVRVDRAGRQYVCEFGNSRIQVFDPTDHSIAVIGQAGSGPGEFNNPWSIAFDSHGNLYVADSQNHRVQKLIARGPL